MAPLRLTSAPLRCLFVAAVCTGDWQFYSDSALTLLSWPASDRVGDWRAGFSRARWFWDWCWTTQPFKLL